MNNPTFTQNAPAVYLVGAGPGDASLLTIRAAYLLKHASCVIYDYLVSDEIVGMCNAHAECIFVGKKGFTQHVTQDEINALLLKKARQAQDAAAGMCASAAEAACGGAAAETCNTSTASRSQVSVPDYAPEQAPVPNYTPEQTPVPNYAPEQARGCVPHSISAGESEPALNYTFEHAQRPYVVRLKGGDPYIFGRGGEEALVLHQHGIAFEVVPGITSGIAALMYAGIPATHRGIATSVTFVTGNEDPSKQQSTTNWQALAGLITSGSSVVLYMGVKNLPHIQRSLAAYGVAGTTPCAAVMWGTCAQQKSCVTTLEQAFDVMQRKGIAAPCIIVIGDVATLHEQLNWFEKRPLFGKTVLITRTRTHSSHIRSALQEAGARVLEVPALRVVPPTNTAALHEAVARLASYDWVVFTSANGVDACFDALRRLPGEAPCETAGDARRDAHDAARDDTCGNVSANASCDARRDARREVPCDARAFGSAQVAVIGSATAETLQSYGIVPDCMPQAFVAESLVEALQAAGVCYTSKVLILRAEEARDTLVEGLRALGAQVDVVSAYHSEKCTEQLKQVLSSGVSIDACTFASSSAVKATVDALGDDAQAFFSQVDVFSIGPITTRTMLAHGITPAAEARIYNADGLVDALCAYYSHHATP